MSSRTETIAALLTPLAPGAIAVIGISGERTDEILSKILRKRSSSHPPEIDVKRPVLCQVVEAELVIDDAIVVRISSKNHAWAELNVHGGVWVARRVLALLEQHGATIVDGMDFSDVIQPVDSITRDIRRALVNARSRRMMHWLLSQAGVLPGFLSRFDMVSSIERRDFLMRSRAAIKLVRGLNIAIVGAPNVGKSTLANRLLGMDRIITSDVPGTTRDWISETALVEGWPVTLTDTAGIRDTECAIENEAILRGGAEARRADLVLLTIDATSQAMLQDRQIADIRAMLPQEMPIIAVHNKCDLPATHRTIASSKFKSIFVSARTGDGIDELSSAIASALGLDLLEKNLPAAFLPDQLPQDVRFQDRSGLP